MRVTISCRYCIAFDVMLLFLVLDYYLFLLFVSFHLDQPG